MSARVSEFERAAYGRDRERALSLMVQVLREVEKGDSLGPTDPEGMTVTASRIASAICVLFSDPKLRLTQKGFENLVIFNRAVNVVFGASAFGDSAHLMRAVAKRPKKADDWRKFLAISTMDALRPDVIRALGSAPSQIALPGVCALLTGATALTESAESARAALLKTGRQLRKMKLTDPTLETLIVSWMNCSYSADRKKHDLKNHLNHLIEGWLSERGLRPAAEAQADPARARPRVVVCAEWWTSFHAMYRCYGPSVEQLRDRFEVILVAEPEKLDEAARGSVDRVVEIPFQVPNVDPFVRAIHELAPDVIIYPSLGMSAWAVCLANLRLAPLQLMMLGHPAPSRSRHVDFVVTEVGHEGSPDQYTERVALLRKGGHPFVPVQSEVPAPSIKRTGDIVFAVPSNALKLNARFLSVCERIAEGSKERVSFQFFHNQKGLQHRRIERAITARLDNAVVHARSDYETYLKRLNACDVHLGVFPFGGTNSNVDTMRLALPMVSMRGEESHATGETEMLERADVPPWLLPSDEDGYVRAARRLVEEPEVRCSIAEGLREVDVDRLFMAGGETVRDEFVSTVWWLHENREALLGSEQRVFRPEDRALGAAETQAPELAAAAG